MPVPTRLANDGWWLCSLPSTPRRGVSPQASSKSNCQMNSNAATALRLPILLDSIPRKLIVALAATAFADWLFYDQKLGLSIALFLSVLAGLSLVINPLHADRRQSLFAAIVLLIGLASIVEEFNVLSASLG